MAAIISRSTEAASSSATDASKVPMLNKLDSRDRITVAILLKRENGVITIGDDRNVKVWLLRDTGQYWPSICQQISAIPSVMDYSHLTRRLFVGAENGVISEYEIADDFNSLGHVRNYFAHTGGVSCVLFAVSCEWVLSCGKDKTLAWHDSETGRRLGGHSTASWCTSLAFDAAAQYAFVGDYSGTVWVLRIKHPDGCQEITKLSAHAGSVRSLAWDPERQMLFSGSFDNSVICWDIGGKKGTAFELQGHKAKVVRVAFASGKRRLFSADDDGLIICWDMSAKRDETPEWRTSDNCERCNNPFFWNVKEMWTKKIVGQRQHHCRICGKAVCDKCSQARKPYPPMGYEYAVRVCDGCDADLAEKNTQSLVVFHNVKHSIIDMYLDEMQGKLLTVGTDRVVKIWDVSKLVR